MNLMRWDATSRSHVIALLGCNLRALVIALFGCNLRSLVIALLIASWLLSVKVITYSGLNIHESNKVSNKPKVHQEITEFVDQSKVSPSNCTYENAVGSFAPSENSRFSWNWTSKSNDCPVVDYVGRLLHKSSYDDTFRVREPITFLFVGDSLDRNLVAFACEEGLQNGFQVLPTLRQLRQNGGGLVDGGPSTETGWLNLKSALINQARDEDRAAKLCRAGNTTLAHFKIFGMNRLCPNRGLAADSDSRSSLFPLTADRVKGLLPVEILSRIPTDSKVIALVASSLWDLSDGCAGKGMLNESYAVDYMVGIRRLHQVLNELVPNITVYWRTSPPVSLQYSMIMEKTGYARTRQNQKFLNSLLKKIVADENLGVVVDWWAQLEEVPESTITDSMEDHTRHYSKEPSLAFLNMWLNAIFYYDPSLLVSRY